LTAGQGFEPQLPRPERGVLPLDDPAIAPQYQKTRSPARKRTIGVRAGAGLLLLGQEVADLGTIREDHAVDRHEHSPDEHPCTPSPTHLAKGGFERSLQVSGALVGEAHLRMALPSSSLHS
tara:strand:- start:1689 stop:2051 length:363 start_codon:yes stop_codon:yes gene_type:complete